MTPEALTSATIAGRPSLLISVLGLLEVYSGAIRVEVGGKQHRKLLAFLTLNANHWVSSGAIGAVLWPDVMSLRIAALHSRISELRAVLRQIPGSPASISTNGSNYLLSVDSGAIDAIRFINLCREARAQLKVGNPGDAAQLLSSAQKLWRGSPYGDIDDEPAALAEISRLDALRMQMHEDLVDVELESGHHAEVAADLLALVEEHPLREHLWAQLMVAQYRAGLQSDSLRTYDQVRRQLRDRLGVDPGPELQDVHARILRHDVPGPIDTPTLRPARIRTGNVFRSISTFHGRESELRALLELTQKFRVVSIIGLGGMGKTRLAMEFCSKVGSVYAGGVWLVDLAQTNDPSAIPTMIADVMELREHAGHSLLDTVSDALADAEVLLVLDNCEHLLAEAANVIERIVSRCPLVRVLATSRERLPLRSGTVLVLNGLALPDAKRRNGVVSSDSVRLFIDRAIAVDPHLSLGDHQSDTIARLIRRLDGIPLAIELVAAHCSAFGLDDIDSYLQANASPIESRDGSGRHASLRTTILWSYESLSPTDRVVFDRASIFESGFTIDALEAVCAQPRPSVMSSVWQLVNMSLIVRDSFDHGRFRVLETLRAIGAENLAAADTAQETAERFGVYFLSFVERMSTALRTGSQRAALDALESEHYNLRRALKILLSGGRADSAASMTVGLYRFWALRGHYRDGQDWLDRVLTGRFARGKLADEWRIRCLMGVATLAVVQGDLGLGRVACVQAKELAEQIGDRVGVAHSLQYLGFGSVLAGDAAGALPLLTEASAQARLGGDSWLLAWSAIMLGAVHFSAGQGDAALEQANEAERLLGSNGDPEGLAWIALLRAAAAAVRGQMLHARAHLLLALEGFGELKGIWGLSIVMLLIALTLQSADPELQAEFLGVADHLRSDAGAAEFPILARLRSGVWDGIIRELTPARAEAAFQLGRSVHWKIAALRARTALGNG